MIIDFLRSLHTFELASLTVLIGVLVNTAMLRIGGISPGGILSTAFCLMAAGSSIYWAASLLILAPCISWLYSTFFSRIYEGRQPVFIMTIMSVTAAAIISIIMDATNIMPIDNLGVPLGMILPAIVASAVHKQGFFKTYRYLTVALFLVAELMVIIVVGGNWLGLDLTSMQRSIDSRAVLDLNWGALFAVASAILGYLMYRRFKVKSAGFIILPLMATLAVVSPLNFLLLLLTAAIVYAIAVVLRRYTLVVGTSRYALVCTLSICVVWTITYLLLHFTGRFSPYMGSGVFAALASSVIANEHTMYGVKRTFPLFIISLAIMATIEVAVSLIVAMPHPGNALRYYVIHQEVRK